MPAKHVIPGNDGGPAPIEPYATLLLEDDPALARPVRYQQPNGSVTNVSYRRAAFSLQFYRKGAVERAQAFCLYAESENGLIDQADYGWRVAGLPLEYSRLDGIMGDAFEERAVIELAIDHTVTTTQDAGVFDNVEYALDYGGQTKEGQHGP